MTTQEWMPKPAVPRTLLGNLLAVAALGLVGCVGGTQGPDLEFRYAIETPRHEAGSGPRVGIDAGHGNFHTVDERFAPFAQLLRDDGYRVEGFDAPFSAEALAGIDVLVVANPLAEANQRRWRLPNYGAFPDDEIAALREWIEGGGSLLLIADHMPFPGAAEALAAELGVFFTNGYARDGDDSGWITFRREDGTLLPHAITEGDGDSSIEYVKIFTGQAFRVARDARVEPLMVMPEGSKVLLPSKPRDFDERTPYVPAEDLLQGATLRIGEGRLAVFGEAAMFTAQIATRGKESMRFGMSAPNAEHNPRFVLNVLHWLSQNED